MGISVILFLLVGVIPSYSSSYDIPPWVKAVASFWAEGDISDDDFGEAILFLIDQEVLKIPLIASLREQVAQLESDVDRLEKENKRLREGLDEVASPTPSPKPSLPTPTPGVAHVLIPTNTSSPGCELANKCYDPAVLRINSGESVTWINKDTTEHTVTSGNPKNGPNGIFDSGLFGTDEIFSVEFTKSGNYHYYCVVHPWMEGDVFVSSSLSSPGGYE